METPSMYPESFSGNIDPPNESDSTIEKDSENINNRIREIIDEINKIKVSDKGDNLTSEQRRIANERTLELEKELKELEIRLGAIKEIKEKIKEISEIEKEIKEVDEDTYKIEELKKKLEKLKKELGDLKRILSKKEDDGSVTPDSGAYSPDSEYDDKSSDESSDPSYTAEDSYYDSSYDPGGGEYEPDPGEEEYYGEVTPEVRDFREEALRLINKLSRRDEGRAIERFGGFRPFAALANVLRLFRLRTQAEALNNIDEQLSAGPIGTTIGRIRAWFDRVGQRSISDDSELSLDENLERAGVFTRNPWWKKCLKIGAKAIGGVGVAGAMVLTGGLGAATTLLWAGGVKESYDSVLQSVEQIGWGRRRSRAELESQANLSVLIDELKSRVVDTENPITEEEFTSLVENIISRESGLMDRQCQNISSERKWQVGRSIATSVLTIGTACMAGAPVGTINYDQDNTALANSMRAASGTPNVQVMNEAHRGFWNVLHGGQFGYGHENLLGAVQDSINGTVPSGQEYGHMQSIINFLNETVQGKFGTFSLEPTSVYGQTSHVLGQGLAWADKLKLGSALLYLIAEPLRHLRGKDSGEEYTTPGPDDPTYEGEGYSGPVYESDSAYSPTAPDEAYDSSESDKSKEALSEKEKKAIIKYFESLKKTYDAEKKASSDSKPTTEKSKYYEDLIEKSKDLPPMKSECRLALCVPAAYSEHGTIGGYLESLLLQQDRDGVPINPNLYEVNIFVNGVTKNTSEIEQTVTVINEFKKQHPEININVISGTYEQRKNIGYYRKLVTDSVLFRSKTRPEQNGPLYIISHDADIRMRDQKYLTSILSKMDDSPDTKVMAGNIDYSEEDRKRFPILWATRRLWQYLDIIRTNSRYGNIPSKAVGNNTVIRAESYAEAGGYRINSEVAEDLTLVDDIIRKYPELYKTRRNEFLKRFPNRVEASPRRDLNSIRRGKNLDAGYENFETNDEARDRSLDTDQAVENIRPENEDVFRKQLETEANAQLGSLFMKVFYEMSNNSQEMIEAKRRRDPDLSKIQDRVFESNIGAEADARTQDIFRKACGFLGIKDVDISKSVAISRRYGTKKFVYRVKINDWSKLRDSLIEKTK